MKRPMRSPPTSADLVAILLSGFSHQDRALRKLRQLDAAATVEDLRNPPGNRLETLKRDRAGQMSIQWRICFRWSKGDADDVEIVDYHS